MMKRFGQLGLTTVSNGLNFVAQTIGILSQTHGQMYAYVMATVRIPTPTTSFKRTHTNLAKVVYTRDMAMSQQILSNVAVRTWPGRAQARRRGDASHRRSLP